MIDTTNPVSVYMQLIGRKGGKSKSARKLAAVNRNLKLARSEHKAGSVPNAQNKSLQKAK